MKPEITTSVESEKDSDNMDKASEDTESASKDETADNSGIKIINSDPDVKKETEIKSDEEFTTESEEVTEKEEVNEITDNTPSNETKPIRKINSDSDKKDDETSVPEDNKETEEPISEDKITGESEFNNDSDKISGEETEDKSQDSDVIKGEEFKSETVISDTQNKDSEKASDENEVKKITGASDKSADEEKKPEGQKPFNKADIMTGTYLFDGVALSKELAGNNPPEKEWISKMKIENGRLTIWGKPRLKNEITNEIIQLPEIELTFEMAENFEYTQIGIMGEKEERIDYFNNMGENLNSQDSAVRIVDGKVTYITFAGGNAR